MNNKEAVIERKVCMWAEHEGWLCLKYTPFGSNGWPDRFFIKDGRVVFIEFKAPREEPRALQGYCIERMKRHGAEVHVVDSVDEGIRILGGGI